MANRDWTGDKRSILTQMGARNYAQMERDPNDYYATEPKALELLLDEETFSNNVWECACGEGHLSQVLVDRGFNVRSTDLIDRGYGEGGIDFLWCQEPFDGDIITNPPYKFALEFVKHALDLITEGHKAAFFLKIQFLEGKARRKFFDVCPPRKIYVSTGRLHCAINGNWDIGMRNNAASYAWFIWEKGNTEAPIVKWFN